MPINSGLILKGLTEAASVIANEAIQNAPTNRIKENIQVNPATATSEGFEVSIQIDISENGAPEAPAYEWGSGIHSTKGPRQPYEILPRNAQALAIPFSKWPSFTGPIRPGPKMIGEGNKGLLLRKVLHPGVEARPYMTPAIIRNLPTTRQKIRQSVKASFISSRRVEVIS